MSAKINFYRQFCKKWLASICIWGTLLSSCAFAEEAAQPVFLFGKMEVKSSLASVPMWTDAIARNARKPLFTDAAVLQGHPWPELKAQWSALPLKKQLTKVNNFWNKWPYRQDQETCNVFDYWATPYEFYKNSGDCEDYAIIKYFTLAELGIPKKNMRIALVKNIIRNVNHAVLVVFDDGDALVLDSVNSQVASHRVYKHYDIQFSLNEFYKWGHFIGKGQTP